MSVTRTHRLIRLLQLLQSGRDFDAEGLAESLSVSRRTLFRDLNSLDAARVPLFYDRKTQRYSIKKEYFLPPVNLTMAESLALMLTTRKIASRKVHPDHARALDAALKVEANIPIAIRQHCGTLLEHIEFRTPPTSDVEGIRHLMGIFHRAMYEKRKLRLSYDSYYEGTTIDLKLHPYRLVFVGRAWYVVGYSEVHRQLRTFKLERVEKVELLAPMFETDSRFDLDDYFGNAWQMIRGDKRYTVKIRFAPKVAGNVEEVLWHKTQQMHREEDGSLLFEVEVDGLNEISWWILGYGDQAEVLEPQALREMILKHARNLITQYEKKTCSSPHPSPRPFVCAEPHKG